MAPGAMDDGALLRYSRQILLPEIGLAGQDRLLAAHVLVLGLGGLGAPAATYLAAAGVGRLTLVDPDVVELSNLQRQVIHATADLGRRKVDSARDRLLAINPTIGIAVRAEALVGAALATAAAAADVVVDCTDNFASRYATNAACLAARRPLVTGAALRFEGQVGVFAPGSPGEPCYRCLFDDADEPEERCSRAGVIAPLLGIVGAVQALETLKLITGAGEPLRGRWLRLDALTMRWREARVERDPACAACGGAAP